MTVDDLKAQRDGHLSYGRVKPGDYPRMVEVCPVVAIYRDEAGKVVGYERSDGGRGVVGYGRQTERREDVRRETA